MDFVKASSPRYDPLFTPIPAPHLGSIPGLGRSPGEGNGYPLPEYTHCIVYGVANSQTWLSDFNLTLLSRKWGVRLKLPSFQAWLCPPSDQPQEPIKNYLLRGKNIPTNPGKPRALGSSGLRLSSHSRNHIGFRSSVSGTAAKTKM